MEMNTTAAIISTRLDAVLMKVIKAEYIKPEFLPAINPILLQLEQLIDRATEQNIIRFPVDRK